MNERSDGFYKINGFLGRKLEALLETLPSKKAKARKKARADNAALQHLMANDELPGKVLRVKQIDGTEVTYRCESVRKAKPKELACFALTGIPEGAQKAATVLVYTNTKLFVGGTVCTRNEPRQSPGEHTRSTRNAPKSGAASFAR